MTQEQAARLRDSLSCLYNAIGHDVWADRTPLDDEFADVLLEQLRTHVQTCDQCDATEDDVTALWESPKVEAELLVRKVGP